jgi:lysozyme family protein
MDQTFDVAIKKVLAHEGGYVNDPADPGGETKFGISKRTYPDIDIKALTEDEACLIYYRDWWVENDYDRIAHADLAAKVLDLAVNMGAKRAHMLLQEAVNATRPGTLVVDGRLGPKSIDAVNRHPQPALLLAQLRLAAVGFYARLNKARFLKGWVLRAIS